MTQNIIRRNDDDARRRALWYSFLYWMTHEIPLTLKED